MNANLQKWINALRSGKYAQTKSSLKDANGYCCLGVACDVYQRETGEGGWDAITPFYQTFVIDHQIHSGGLPKKVKQWLGIKDNHEDEYIGMNDSANASFERIAKQVEADYS